MLKISGKQSRAARSLLKWNMPDLAGKTKVRPQRINSFEKGGVQLQGWEMKELVDIYKKAGIKFKGDMSVVLETKKNTAQSHATSSDSGNNSIVIQDESDYSAIPKPEAAKEEDERKKKRNSGTA